MSLAKTKKQVVDYATVNIQLREALQALFDECVMLGELSEAVTGETLDKVREALKAAEQNAHLTPETQPTSQAVVNASASEQSDGDTPPAQAQVA